MIFLLEKNVLPKESDKRTAEITKVKLYADDGIKLKACLMNSISTIPVNAPKIKVMSLGKFTSRETY